jgi:PAS domain S-box-containing protein
MGSAPRTVLVVEDDEHNRLLLETLLADDGLAATMVADGAAALAAVAARLPDLVILDILLPGGMDGFEVVRRLKADPRTQPIPIIILTALLDLESRIAGLQAGAEEFLCKPVDRIELTTRVRNLLKLKEYQDFLAEHNRILEERVLERTASLAASDEHFRAVTQTADAAIVTADAAGTIIGWNAGAERMFGYTGAEVIGQALTLLIPERYRERHLGGMQRVLAGGERHVIGKSVELHGMTKRGNEFPLELSLSEWEAAQGRFFTGIIRDITERKQAQDALLSQLDELRRWEDVGLGREDRVQELKREINELCRRLDEPARYPSEEPAPAQSQAAKPKP